MSASSHMTELTFNILVALTEAPLHGYALVARLRELEGRDALRTGTVYAALARLRDEELVEETAPPADETDARRRYYRVTEDGLVAARAEAARLADVVERARGLRLLEAIDRA